MFPRGIVPTARLLLHPFPTLEEAGLTANLVSEARRTPLIEFKFLSSIFAPISVWSSGPNGNVEIAAELSLLHIRVAYSAINQDLFQRT